MSLGEFFTGTKKKEAAAASSKLEKKAKLSKRDLAEIKRLRKINRTRLGKLGLIGLIGLGIAGDALLTDNNQADAQNLTISEPVVKTTESSLPVASVPPRDPRLTVLPNFPISPEKIRSIYDRGFGLIMGSVPDQNDRFNAEKLREIEKFRRSLVDWVEIRGDGYYPLKSGFRKPAYMAVIPPNHYLLDENGPLLQMDSAHGNNVLKIRPYNIAPEWAGIGLIHELSHLRDRALQLEAEHPSRREWLEGELESYELEIDGMNHFTKGRFKNALLAQIEQFNLESTDDVGFNQDWDRILLNLDQATTGKPPLSMAEAGNRQALYMFALVFEIINSGDFENGEKRTLKIAAIEKIMKSGDGEKHIPNY